MSTSYVHCISVRFVDPKMREAMGDQATSLAKHVGYSSAGMKANAKVVSKLGMGMGRGGGGMGDQTMSLVKYVGYSSEGMEHKK